MWNLIKVNIKDTRTTSTNFEQLDERLERNFPTIQTIFFLELTETIAVPITARKMKFSNKDFFSKTLL